MQLQDLRVGELRVLGLPAQVRLRHPARRVRELHRDKVVRVVRGRLIAPKERLRRRHASDGEAGFALDVLGIESGIEQRAEDAVVAGRGFARGRDGEGLRRGAGTTEVSAA
jgi:hypothetical protein